MSPSTPEPVADRGETQAGVVADRYDRMTALAELFDSTGRELRERSVLGAEIVADNDVSASAPLSPRTWEAAEDEIRRATTGKHGLLPTSTELDADALVVRATVLTYRWIDELAATAERTLGSIAGRAIGYLAPEVELGGAVVAAGLIEAGGDDRDGVAAYLGELAEHHPSLMDHVSTAGNLLDGLQLRSLLTPGVPAEAGDPSVARAGLEATGVPLLAADPVAAVRDVAGDFVSAAPDTGGPGAAPSADHALPSGLGELMRVLAGATSSVEVHRAAPGRFIAYLPGRAEDQRSPLRLVGGDHATYAAEAARVLEAAVASAHDRADAQDAAPTGAPRVMLVGGGRGGVAAADLAARVTSGSDQPFVVDVVVTVGSPASQAPRVGGDVRVLSLEDSADPVALLGSLINAGDERRTSVVFDGDGTTGREAWVLGGRLADEAGHDGLRGELDRLRELGYLA